MIRTRPYICGRKGYISSRFALVLLYPKTPTTKKGAEWDRGVLTRLVVRRIDLRPYIVMPSLYTRENKIKTRISLRKGVTKMVLLKV